MSILALDAPASRLEGHHKAQIEEAQQLFAYHEQHRNRLAMDIHDGVIGTLTSLKLNADSLLMLLDRPPTDTAVCRARVEYLRDGLEGSLNELRSLIAQIQPPGLDQGLQVALTQLCRRLTQTSELKSEVLIGIRSQLSPIQQLTVYRICQEAVTNVVKHSQSSLVTIRLNDTDQYLTLTITDNGRGFADVKTVAVRPAPLRATGLGLPSMRQRTEALGGVFTVTSNSEQGTRVSARWLTVTLG